MWADAPRDPEDAIPEYRGRILCKALRIKGNMSLLPLLLPSLDSVSLRLSLCVRMCLCLCLSVSLICPRSVSVSLSLCLSH